MTLRRDRPVVANEAAGELKLTAARAEIDGDKDDLPEMKDLTDQERKGLRWSLVAMVLGMVILAVTAWPVDSPWRNAEGVMTGSDAPGSSVGARTRVASRRLPSR